MSSFLMRRATAAPRALRAFSTTPTRNVARITVVGNLAATPELHATSTGNDIIKYAVASNTGSSENRKTSWFNIAAFVPEGGRRDFITSIPKGSMVMVEGDASMNSFEDAEGKNRTALNIVQRSIEVLKRPASDPSQE